MFLPTVYVVLVVLDCGRFLFGRLEDRCDVRCSRQGLRYYPLHITRMEKRKIGKDHYGDTHTHNIDKAQPGGQQPSHPALAIIKVVETVPLKN